jgi:3-hydroxypropanoate dehydrogenase
MKADALDDRAFDILFRKARTHNAFSGEVSDETIKQLYNLLKWGPTSANTVPARFVFVKSKEAKEKLNPYMDKGNAQKTMDAPVTVIIAYDRKFYEQMDKLSPHKKPGEVRGWFENAPPEKNLEHCLRNGSLQGAYLIMAARALGLDCGPMSGFNAKGVNEAFFKGTDWEVNFICNLGQGDTAKTYPRAPRLEFDEACKIL